LKKERLIIGSRGSRLALRQAESVKARLVALYPQLEIKIEIIKTTGDHLKTAPLSIIGGQGVFTKELEQALLARRIDLAVHSLKDLPTVLPDALALAAIPQREDARDCLVLPQTFERHASDLSITTLPHGARVGTSSPRRAAQLRYLRSDLIVKELRGNVDTRLRKLDEGEYDAIILAVAGLKRLGLDDRISVPIATSEMLPAVAQGALGIEICADDEETHELLTPLDDERTRAECTAERALLRGLGGGCQLPIAAHAELLFDVLRLEASVATPDGKRSIRESLEEDKNAPRELGEQLAMLLIERGATSLLNEMSG
jgi:hydroxymethylbilane synthase